MEERLTTGLAVERRRFQPIREQLKGSGESWTLKRFLWTVKQKFCCNSAE